MYIQQYIPDIFPQTDQAKIVEFVPMSGALHLPCKDPHSHTHTQVGWPRPLQGEVSLEFFGGSR